MWVWLRVWLRVWVWNVRAVCARRFLGEMASVFHFGHLPCTALSLAAPTVVLSAPLLDTSGVEVSLRGAFLGLASLTVTSMRRPVRRIAFRGSDSPAGASRLQVPLGDPCV